MKFGTVMMAGQPCLVMQHGDGGLCPVDRLMATADAGTAPADMLELVHRIGDDPTLAAALALAADRIEAKHVLDVDERTDWLPPIGNPSKISASPSTTAS